MLISFVPTLYRTSVLVKLNDTFFSFANAIDLTSALKEVNGMNEYSLL